MLLKLNFFVVLGDFQNLNMKVFFLFFYFILGNIFSQNYNSYEFFFSKNELKIANTAKKNTYLKKVEKEVYYYLNLVRLNPKLFAQTFLENNKESINCLDNYKSLYKNLINMDPVDPLYFDKEFYLYAKCHAIESGKKNYIGHNRTNGSGCEPIKSSFSWAECCYYGNNDPLSIVIDLLIDCNYPGLGHRKIMLSNDFKYMGVYISSHKSFKFNAVLDFRGE